MFVRDSVQMVGQVYNCKMLQIDVQEPVFNGLQWRLLL